MTETIRDENRDKSQEFIIIGQEDLELPGEKINQIRRKLSWTWEQISKKVYNSLQKSYKSDDERENEISKFTNNFKRACGRDQESCRLDQDTKYSMTQYWEAICQLNDVKDLVKLENNEEQDQYTENISIYQENESLIRSYNLELLSHNRFFCIQQYKNTIPKKFGFKLNEDKEIGEYTYLSICELKEFIKDLEKSKLPYLQTWFGNYLYYIEDMPNVTEAKKWYKQAAKQNDSTAQYQLGLIYENKKGIENKVRAFKYYQEAAKNKNPFAYTKLSLCYYLGIGTTRNIKEFFRYAILAADSNELLGLILCGIAYETGQGTDKDIKRSIEYYEKFNQKEQSINLYKQKVLLKLAFLYKSTENQKKFDEYIDFIIKNAIRMFKEHNELIFELFPELPNIHINHIHKIMNMDHKVDTYKTNHFVIPSILKLMPFE